MDDNMDDSFEGGYTAYPSIPADELEALHKARPQFAPNTSLTPEYAKALIEKYGHTELHSTVDEDMDDFRPGPTMEQLEEEHRATQDIPDEELDELEYYGRHGFTRTVETCTDPDCPCDRN